jgi:sulfur-carrier protein
MMRGCEVAGTSPSVPHACRLGVVPTMRLFASAREAAGTGTDVFDGATVGDVLTSAEQRYGPRFGEVLKSCKIWVNGDDARADTPVGPSDEVAVLPPVSGGST